VLEWVFQPGTYDLVHLGGMASIEDAVVECCAHVHDLARDELTILDDRSLFDRAKRE
jgi:hypothetical protein